MGLAKEECIEYLETLKNLVCIQTSCCMKTRAEIEEDKKLFSECINYFENLINEHFDNPLFYHYENIRKRVAAQSEVINELNDQLSRYCDWEMKMVQMRQNPPLKFEELKIGKHCYVITKELKVDALITKICDYDKLYDGHRIEFIWIDEYGRATHERLNFKDCKFYTREVIDED